MFRLGKRVMIIADTFEQKLPVGDYGYIIAYDRNNDNAFDYVVRIPKLNRNVYVPAADLELEEVIVKREAERVEQEALIDFALATRNEQLFRYIMTGESGEAEDEKSEEVKSREEFIRQVNLKAWI